MKYYFVAYSYLLPGEDIPHFGSCFLDQESPYFDTCVAERKIIEDDSDYENGVVIINFQEITKEHWEYIEKTEGTDGSKIL